MLQALTGQLKKNAGYSSIGYGLAGKAMSWMVTLMGKDVVRLPELVGLPVEQRAPVRLPSVRECILAGVPLIDAYLGQAQPGNENIMYETLSPLHMATGLLKYGKLNNTGLVKGLTSPDFLVKVFEKIHPYQFEQHTLFNPHGPEEFGLDLLPDDMPMVGNVGCALWFRDEYLRRNLAVGTTERWYIDVARAHVVAPARHRALAKTSLYNQFRVSLKKNRMPDGSVGLYRALDHDEARKAARDITGVREVLLLSRKDATAKEMLKGLRAAAQKHHSHMAYIGRPLTIEDVKGLSPADLLMILYYAPFGTVEDLFKKHRDAMLAEMFTLMTTDAGRISEMAIPHSSRQPGKWPNGAQPYCSTRVPDGKGYQYTYHWTPDEPENLMYALGRPESVELLHQTWEERVKPQVEIYEAQFTWRNRLLAITDIETLFLGFLRWYSAAEDTVHLPAVEAMLRAHPSYHEIRQVMLERPGRQTPEEEEAQLTKELFSIPPVA